MVSSCHFSEYKISEIYVFKAIFLATFTADYLWCGCRINAFTLGFRICFSPCKFSQPTSYSSDEFKAQRNAVIGRGWCSVYMYFEGEVDRWGKPAEVFDMKLDIFVDCDTGLIPSSEVGVKIVGEMNPSPPRNRCHSQPRLCWWPLGAVHVTCCAGVTGYQSQDMRTKLWCTNWSSSYTRKISDWLTFSWRLCHQHISWNSSVRPWTEWRSLSLRLFMSLSLSLLVCLVFYFYHSII